MKRTSFAALTLLASFATLTGSGCSAEAPPDSGSGTAGTAPTNTAGTLSGLPTAGTNSGTPTAGTPSVGGAPNTSAGAGGSSAGTASAGTAAGGTAAGGTGTAGSAGTASGGGTGGTGTANPACPAKIDSAVMCTSVVSCPAATCGAFKLGAKDCKCDAATGPFTCTSCSYAGKTEEIVVTPAAALAACAADDTTLEKNTPDCTKGTRCKSLDTAKSRFCACWDDPVDGGTMWDCDAMPSDWPK